MSFVVERATPRHVAMTAPLPSELRALAGDVVRLATTDPGAATRRVRELLAALPQGHHGELAGAVAGDLDDVTLHRLSLFGAGRDLLVALSNCPHDQIGRLSDALYAMRCDAGPPTARHTAPHEPQPHAAPARAPTIVAAGSGRIVRAVGNAVRAVGEALLEDAQALGQAVADVGKGIVRCACAVGCGIANAARRAWLAVSFENKHDEQRAPAMDETGIASRNDGHIPEAVPVNDTAHKVKASEGAG